MSSLFYTRMKDITLPINIAAGDSNVLPMKDIGYDAESLTVQAPASLDAVTYTWMGSIDGDMYATICGTDGTTALPVPVATKSMSYPFWLFGAYKLLKLHASGAIATADKVFMVVKLSRAP